MALLSNDEAIPWIPIVGGIVHGLRQMGCDARAFHLWGLPDFRLAELVSFRPQLVLATMHFQNVGPLQRFLDELALRGDRARTIVAALCFDDPNDMRTVLAFSKRIDLVLSPAQLAIDCYRREGMRAEVLAPVIDDRLHYPPTEAIAPCYDAFWFGHVGGPPRNAIIHRLRESVTRAGLVWGEVCGVRRWVVGHELTRQLHNSRLTLDLSRCEYNAQTNPHFVPCTFTAPRVHIAAATMTPCLVIDPRADLEHVYPSYAADACSAAEAPERVLGILRDPEKLAGMRERARQAHARYLIAHQPLIRARELLAHVARLLAERERLSAAAAGAEHPVPASAR